MNCPSCGAAMHLQPGEDSLRCDYCESIFYPEKDDDGVRVLGEVTDQDCPVCAIPLTHAALAKVRILYCTRCRGMLMAMDAFVELIDELRALGSGTVPQVAPDRKDLTRKSNCPQCHQLMDTHYYAGPGNVVIDSCDRCSLNWLDHGEIMRIVHAPDGHYAG
jgi:LSD1 subclass zinc finger protein